MLHTCDEISIPNHNIIYIEVGFVYCNHSSGNIEARRTKSPCPMCVDPLGYYVDISSDHTVQNSVFVHIICNVIYITPIHQDQAINTNIIHKGLYFLQKNPPHTISFMMKPRCTPFIGQFLTTHLSDT